MPSWLNPRETGTKWMLLSGMTLRNGSYAANIVVYIFTRNVRIIALPDSSMTVFVTRSTFPQTNNISAPRATQFKKVISKLLKLDMKQNKVSQNINFV